MNIAEILRTQATLHPDAPAILDTFHGGDRQLTFAELERASCHAAALLHQAGLRTGDGVLILQPMSAELYTALAAIFRLGLVALFLDPSAGPEHIERCCALYPPAALIASGKAHLLCLLSPSLRRIARKFVIGASRPGAVPWSHAATLSPHDAMEPCLPDSPALLTFTSGTAGRPRAALRTHGFLLAQHQAIERMTAPTPGEKDLVALPIVVLSNLASGMASLIPNANLRRPGRVRTAPLFEQILAQQPTRLTASPALLERLADAALSEGRTFPNLRKVFTGGGPVFPRVLSKLECMAPNAEIVAVYGSTEAEPISHYSHGSVGAQVASHASGGDGLFAGASVPFLQLRILPDRWGQPIGPYTPIDFEADRLASEEIGEIVVSGEHVLPGYLRGDGDAETRFRVEDTVWLRTGDAGCLDAQGQLWLQGRCDARIQDAHGILYPFAVESAAQRFPGIRRAAVLLHRGQRVLAVTPSQRITESEKMSLLRSLEWAEIKVIHVLRELPVDRRHNAKIDYPALRRLLERAR